MIFQPKHGHLLEDTTGSATGTSDMGINASLQHIPQKPLYSQSRVHRDWPCCLLRNQIKRSTIYLSSHTPIRQEVARITTIKTI